jgi:hypothetical protein
MMAHESYPHASPRYREATGLEVAAQPSAQQRQRHSNCARRLYLSTEVDAAQQPARMIGLPH